MMTLLIISYIVVISIYGFLIMGLDKRRARKQQWRIPESKIWIVTFCGGAIGTFVGMYIFHHKTKHKQFYYGLPILAVIWSVAYLYVWLVF